MASTFQVSDWTGGTYQDRRYMSESLSFHFPFVAALWCLGVNHNYNKILKSDWLSTALISALIGQFNRTVCIMPQ